MASVGSYMASKKKSAVILRTLYPCEFNPKINKVREIIAVVKDFTVVPPNLFTNYIESYLTRFGVNKIKTAELIADSSKSHEFTKNDKTYIVQVTNTDSYKILVSEKVSGYVYGHSYINTQLVCEFESLSAPSQIFNNEQGTLQVVFNNYVDELKARFSTN